MDNEQRIHTLRSSSKGNAEIVCFENAKILVDCGISGKTVDACLAELGMSGSDIDAVLVTHEHTDHIKGVGIFSRKYNIPVYANCATWKAMAKSVGKIPEANVKVFQTDAGFEINGVCVRPFEIPHDAAAPVGYTFEAENDKVAVATDIGEIRPNIFEAVKGCSEILLEANYDLSMLEMGPYPYDLKRRIKGSFGHLCNDDAGEFAVKLAENGTKRIILGHLSWENNYPDLAFYTVRNILNEAGADVNLSVAQRDCTGDICPQTNAV